MYKNQARTSVKDTFEPVEEIEESEVTKGKPRVPLM